LARAEFALGNEEAALDAVRRTEQLLPGDAAPPIRGEIVYGYGLLGQAEDARRAFELVRDLAVDRYVDASTWAWAYMGVGDYEEALRQLNTAAENLELLQGPWLAHFIGENTWSDPILDQPEWVEMRSRLGFRE
jgi:tetratricopeptide (TPR) repeat protein